MYIYIYIYIYIRIYYLSFYVYYVYRIPYTHPSSFACISYTYGMFRLFICIYMHRFSYIHTYTHERTSPAYVRIYLYMYGYMMHTSGHTKNIHTYTYISHIHMFLHICSAIISLGCDSLNVTLSYVLYSLFSFLCTPQTRSCPSRLTAIIANRRYRCTSSGAVRKSSSRVKASRSQAQGRTLRLFGTDLMRDAIIRRRSPRVILLSYPLYHNTIRISRRNGSASSSMFSQLIPYACSRAEDLTLIVPFVTRVLVSSRHLMFHLAENLEIIYVSR